MLKVILVGYGELASSLMLGILESQHKLVAIFPWRNTKSDFLSMIESFFIPDSFYSLLKAYKIAEIYAPGINSEDFKKQVSHYKPDVIIIGAWGEILKKETIIFT